MFTFGGLKGISGLVHCLFYFTEFFLLGLYLDFIYSSFQVKNSFFAAFSIIFNSSKPSYETLVFLYCYVGATFLGCFDGFSVGARAAYPRPFFI